MKRKQRLLGLSALALLLVFFIILIVRTSAFGNWDYVSKKGTLTVSFAKTATTSRVQLEQGGNTTLFTQPMNAPTLTQQGDVYIFTDSTTKTQFVYSVSEEGLKEDMILTNKPSTSILPVDITTNGLVLILNKDNQPEFSTKTGEYQFHLEVPWAKDAIGATNHNFSYTKGTATGDTTTLNLILDAQWLSAPTTKYPVTIDPNVKFRGVKLQRVGLAQLPPATPTPDPYTNQSLCSTTSDNWAWNENTCIVDYIQMGWGYRDEVYDLCPPEVGVTGTPTWTNTATNVWKDNTTGLYWTEYKGVMSKDPYEPDWSCSLRFCPFFSTVPRGNYDGSDTTCGDAINYCATLSQERVTGQGTKTNWYLPTLKELGQAVRHNMAGSGAGFTSYTTTSTRWIQDPVWSIQLMYGMYPIGCYMEGDWVWSEELQDYVQGPGINYTAMQIYANNDQNVRCVSRD